MRISKGLQLALRLKDVSTKALAIEIADILISYQDGNSISEQEKFVVGLRYYEFYANSTDNSDYCLAIDKQKEFLNYLHIDQNELYRLVDGIFAEMKAANR